MLNATRVDELFNDCLFGECRFDETETFVKVEGIIHNYGFHPDKLEVHKAEIESLLAQLPDEFHKSKGGGMSFLNACNDRHGNQWGEHINMEQLFSLGIAIGAAKMLMPRSMWGVLPGGMPYYSVDVKEKA